MRERDKYLNETLIILRLIQEESKSDTPTFFCRRHGICGNMKSAARVVVAECEAGGTSAASIAAWHRVQDTSQDVFIEFCKKWRRYSGRPSFPVPAVGHTRGGRPREAFFDALDRGEMWSRDLEYGRLRHELLEFVIERIERRLSEPQWVRYIRHTLTAVGINW